jgi:Domain of unknown function (DUF1707)
MTVAGGSPPAGPHRILGDADRERLVGLLREHYAEGRLDLDELRRRVGVVLGASYADEAAAALAGLPPSLAAGQQGADRGPRGHRRRHAQAAEPGPGWVPTPERFRDPASGLVMRVWTDPADGSRHYVPDDADL